LWCNITNILNWCYRLSVYILLLLYWLINVLNLLWCHIIWLSCISSSRNCWLNSLDSWLDCLYWLWNKLLLLWLLNIFDNWLLHSCRWLNNLLCWLLNYFSNDRLLYGLILDWSLDSLICWLNNFCNCLYWLLYSLILNWSLDCLICWTYNFCNSLYWLLNSFNNLWLLNNLLCLFWLMNDLSLNSLIFYSLLNSFLRYIFNDLFLNGVWDIFSDIFDFLVISNFFFSWNIFSSLDSFIFNDRFFIRKIFNSRFSLDCSTLSYTCLGNLTLWNLLSNNLASSGYSLILLLIMLRWNLLDGCWWD